MLIPVFYWSMNLSPKYLNHIIDFDVNHCYIKYWNNAGKWLIEWWQSRPTVNEQIYGFSEDRQFLKRIFWAKKRVEIYTQSLDTTWSKKCRNLYYSPLVRLLRIIIQLRMLLALLLPCISQIHSYRDNTVDKASETFSDQPFCYLQYVVTLKVQHERNKSNQKIMQS